MGPAMGVNLDALSSYSVVDALRGGEAILIRALRPDDQDRLLEHFNRLSETSRYLRFFGYKRRLDRAELARLCNIDFDRHIAVVATLTKDGHEYFVGVGRYVRLADDPRCAELAFAVLDEFQGRGVGTLLLQHLSGIARSQGVQELEAYVMGENQRMIEVLEHSGFRVRRRYEDGTIRFVLPLGGCTGAGRPSPPRA